MSVYCQTKANKVTVTARERAFGSIILKYVEANPAPSIFAASSNSFGTPRKNCRIIKMKRPFLNPTQVTDDKMNGNGVPIRFTPRCGKKADKNPSKSK